MHPFRVFLLVGVAELLLLGTSPASLGAQHPVEGQDWSVQMLRPSGQPVVPLFEGWFQNDDGSYTLSFGYISLNLEEAMDIPLGPDNFIEPSRYDGLQPTHFVPVHRQVRRGWSVFTVTVPEDFADQRVVWTLKNRGHTFSVPAHLKSPEYILDDKIAHARYVAATGGATQGDVIGAYAPAIRLSPSGRPESGVGGVTTGPVSARVGEPLPVTVWVEDAGDRPVSWLYWKKHQGHGAVTFSETEIEVPISESGGTATTMVTFSEPGDYVLAVQAIESLRNSFEYHCCWTNGYVKVSVRP